MATQDSRFIDLAWIGPALAVGALVFVIARRVRRDARRFEEERASPRPQEEPEEESEEDIPPPPEVVPVTGYIGDRQAAEAVARLQQQGIPAVALYDSMDDVIAGRAMAVGTLVVVPPDRQPEAVHLLDPHPDEGSASMAEIEAGFRDEGEVPAVRPPISRTRIELVFVLLVLAAAAVFLVVKVLR